MLTVSSHMYKLLMLGRQPRIILYYLNRSMNKFTFKSQAGFQ